jgi:hypothetical protein
MIFDPPNTWWIRVGQPTAYTLSEAPTAEILAELAEIKLRGNGWALQITPGYALEDQVRSRLRMLDEILALHTELVERIGRIVHGFQDRQSGA